MRYASFPSGLLLLAAAIQSSCDATDQAHRVVGQLESDRIEIAADVAEPILQIHVVEG